VSIQEQEDPVITRVGKCRVSEYVRERGAAFNAFH
jgi:hypothetical protein